MKYYYDVVLSFAGEDREYVEECAEILTSLGIKVFYDSYEQDVLWGKDLYTFLADIYSNKARYAIVFISQHYVKKRWTKHEFKFINERMFKSETDYLLPVFLDDTKLSGIPQTQGYLMNKTPYEVAVLFAKKINKGVDVELMKSELQKFLPTYKITIKGSDVYFKSDLEEFESNYPLSFLMELYKHNMLFELFVLLAIVPN
ncbi:MAG: TIR domain-containing protein [Lachnospiraceae bacterium]|nr:TIR domain-containing protein [Lachnospiraceae bacterium]